MYVSVYYLELFQINQHWMIIKTISRNNYLILVLVNSTHNDTHKGTLFESD